MLNLKTINSSSCSSQHPNKLLIETIKVLAFPSLKLPTSSSAHQLQWSTDQRREKGVNTIPDYILYRNGDNVKLYKMESIHDHLCNKLEVVRTLFFVKISTSQ
ncbi:hypothetical protein HID58_074610 [Brassica napus]|uniref:Glutaredoxin-like protein n=1 Tax=Brassica napus TaxID=3708 RepID=A0ABQ7YHB6_BRANA|nr:hypothetical protein HID58_074610 [Brassica napus]